jgi:hypothetical protein
MQLTFGGNLFDDQNYLKKLIQGNFPKKINPKIYRLIKKRITMTTIKSMRFIVSWAFFVLDVFGSILFIKELISFFC